MSEVEIKARIVPTSVRWAQSDALASSKPLEAIDKLRALAHGPMSSAVMRKVTAT
jgi:hypothetical protein